MNINRENYESVLVDYLDGKLSPEDEAELMLFLLKNPDIAEEFDGLQEVAVNPNQVSYPNKTNLKKQSVLPFAINNEVEYLCIAELEGDINSEEETKLNRIIATNENLRHIKTVFTSTKLNVPHEIVYPYKNQLKRLRVIPIRRTTYRIAMSVAATVTIMLAVYTAIDFDKTTQIASSSTKPVEITNENKPVETNIRPVEVQKSKTNHLKSKKKEISKPKSTILAIQESTLPKSKSISSIPIKLNQIEAIAQTKFQIPQNNAYSSTDNELLNTLQTKNIGVAKEYTLLDLAHLGLRRVANSLGIEYNIQKNTTGKVEKLSIESNMLAFSTTIGKKDE